MIGNAHEQVRDRGTVSSKVVRFLSSALRGEDRYASRTDLPTVTLADLRRMFDYPSDDPCMYNGYQVTPKQQQFIEALTGEVLDMNGYSYWDECEASE